MSLAEDYIQENRDEIFSDLQKLIGQKSISPTGEGIEECVELVSDLCEKYGFEDTEVIDTSGQPGVVASKFVEEQAPTIILYGHYDVQPVEESKWEKHPFDPEIEENEDGEKIIHARGAGDNKGQFFAHLPAVKTLENAGELNANVILLLEGEEETGSPNLAELVEKADVLKEADFLICADGPKEENDLPVVELGCRGVLYSHLKLKTGESNLHSGEFGGLERNASLELSQLISSIKNKEYEVQVQGFYENVREPQKQEKEWIEELEDKLGSETKHDLGKGEGLEKIFLYPNLNFAGIKSGEGGESVKTIIPADASTNIGVRLVANQSADEIFQKLKSHIKEHITPGIDFELHHKVSVEPYVTDRNSVYIEKVVNAVNKAHEEKTLVKPVSSATLPLNIFKEKLGIESVKIPYGNSDEKNHSPEENMKINCVYSGIKTTTSLLKEIGGE